MTLLKNYKSTSLVAFIAVFLFSVLALTYTGCKDNNLNEPDSGITTGSLLKPTSEPDNGNLTIAQKIERLDNAVKDFALIVAISLKDIELRKFYKSEGMKRFDGDDACAILYSRVKDNLVCGKTLNSILSEIVKDIKKSNELKFKTQFNTLDELVSKIHKYQEGIIVSVFPVLEISIPRKCEEWNTDNFIPTVAPFGISLTGNPVYNSHMAYESDGKEIQMPAIEWSGNIALVIFFNNRLDENGNVRKCYL